MDSIGLGLPAYMSACTALHAFFTFQATHMVNSIAQITNRFWSVYKQACENKAMSVDLNLCLHASYFNCIQDL